MSRRAPTSSTSCSPPPPLGNTLLKDPLSIVADWYICIYKTQWYYVLHHLKNHKALTRYSLIRATKNKQRTPWPEIYQDDNNISADIHLAQKQAKISFYCGDNRSIWDRSSCSSFRRRPNLFPAEIPALFQNLKEKQEVNSFLFQNFSLKDENSAHVDEVEDRCHEVMDIGTNCLCRLLSNIISLQSFCSSTSQQKSAFESNAEQNLNLQMQEMLKIKMVWTLNKQTFVSVNVWLWCGAHHIFEWMQKQACLKYLEIGFGFGDPTTSNDFCCQLVNIAIFKCSLPCNCFS